MRYKDFDFKKDFAVFILTHKRANNVYTYDSLKKHGYTGKIFFIVDNTDTEIKDYQNKFGKENVIIFDKEKYAKQTDLFMNTKERGGIIFARNASFDIAKDLRLKFFIQLDDDYLSFEYRIPSKNGNKLLTYEIKNLDAVFKSMVNFLNTNKKVTTIAMAQGGDYIGGVNGNITKGIRLKRKAMNSFIFDVKEKTRFIGFINEDVNTYTIEQTRGKIFFTFNFVMLRQKQTQTNKGGMTDLYKDSGTYIKSFYTILTHPSGTKISLMGNKDMRIHHNIIGKYTYPKILNEKYKKK